MNAVSRMLHAELLYMHSSTNKRKLDPEIFSLSTNFTSESLLPVITKDRYSLTKEKPSLLLLRDQPGGCLSD